MTGTESAVKTEIVQWDAKYAIGVPQIDSQHQRLVGMIARLQHAILTDDAAKEEGQIIKSLVDYTRYHFAQEQIVMKRIGFEEMEHHLELHRGMTQTIAEMLKKLRSGQYTMTPELIPFLMNWLTEHILTEDRKIGEAVKRFEHSPRRPVTH